MGGTLTIGNQTYNGLTDVTIPAASISSTSVDASNSQQTVTISAGYVDSQKTITIKGADLNGNATTANVLSGKTFYSSNLTQQTGAMPDHGAVTASLDTSTTSYTIPIGYHNGSGTVSIITQSKLATKAETITPDSGKVLSSVSVRAGAAAAGAATSTAELYTGTTNPNLVSTVVAGRQTSLNGKYGIITSTTDADTYFYTQLSETLIAGTSVTFSCYVSGFPNNDCSWPFGCISQSSGQILSLKNGYNSYSFTITDNTSNILFDDLLPSGFTRGQYPIIISNIKLEKGTSATPWIPNATDTTTKNIVNNSKLNNNYANGEYYVPIKTTGTGYSKITTAGWMNTGDLASATTNGMSYVSIPKATFDVDGANVKVKTAGYIDGTGAVGTIGNAAFANLSEVTTTASNSKVGIVTSAGYSPINYATGITIPAGTSTTTRNWSTTSNNYNDLYQYGSGTQYFGYGGQTYSGPVYIGNRTSGTTNKTVGTISTVSLLGYSTSTDKCDTITTLNVGTSTTNKGAQISNLNNYGRIDNLYLNGGFINNLYGSGQAVTKTNNTLATYVVGAYSGTNVGGTITSLSLGTGTSSIRGGRISTLDMKAYSQIGELKCDSSSTIETLSGIGTIKNVSGTLNIENNAVNGTITVNAYNNASTPTLTGNKTIVSGGKWVKTPLNYASATGDYYGWISYTKPADATFSNTATSEVIYTDYSNNAPVLISDDYLYINAGYTPARKISLAQLVPNGATIVPVEGKSAQILNTYAAYDNDGKLVAGTIPVRGNYTVNADDMIGKYSGKHNDNFWVRYPYGYYEDKSSKAGCSWLYIPPSYIGDAETSEVLDGRTFSSSAGLKVSGTMPNNGAVSATLDTTTTSYTVPTGYHNGSGTVSITTQTKSASSAGTISPDSGKLLSSVSVGAGVAAAGVATSSAELYAGTTDTSIKPNLLLNSSQTRSITEKTGNDFIDYNYQDSLKTSGNGKYIVSFDAKSAGSSTVDIYFRNSSGAAYALSSTIKIESSTFSRYSLEINGDPAQIELFRVRLYANTSTVTLKNVKLEKNSTATPWIPNAADTGFTLINNATVSNSPSNYYIPVKTTGTGYSKITTAGWMNTGDLLAATATDISYVSISEVKYNTNNISFDTNAKYPTLVTTAGYAATNRIKGVKIVTPTGDTPNEFEITVPNGSTSSFITFIFKVDKTGNVWVE